MSKILSIFILFLSISVQAALPKELPTAPAKFLTGACRTGADGVLVRRYEKTQLCKSWT